MRQNSVLLNVYGYSGDTREELVTLIEKNSDRVRLPHQFGLEYARNRCRVVIKQVHNYLSAEKELARIRSTYIAPKRDHPFLTKKSLDAYDSIQQELAESRNTLEQLIGFDAYAEKLIRIFEGKISQTPSPEQLLKLCSEAEERYRKLIPPGYSDIKEKAGADAYGDYIGWYQLMEIAKLEHKGIIFVIDDFKEDWWQIERERTVGPRPELLSEFNCVTEQKLYMYTSENFLRAAQRFMAADIGAGVIEEVTQRLESQRQTQRATETKASSAAADPDTEKALSASEDQLTNQLKPTISVRPSETDKSDPRME
jgi:hypothetical protein